DPGSLNEDGPLGKSGIPGRRAELFSFQIFRRRDATALARDDRAGGLVVNHKDRFERGASLLVAELDECVDIAEAHVIGAGRNATDRSSEPFPGSIVTSRFSAVK